MICGLYPNKTVFFEKYCKITYQRKVRLEVAFLNPVDVGRRVEERNCSRNLFALEKNLALVVLEALILIFWLLFDI